MSARPCGGLKGSTHHHSIQRMRDSHEYVFLDVARRGLVSWIGEDFDWADVAA